MEHDLLDLVDNIKGKITDSEYKELVETLQKVQKKPNIQVLVYKTCYENEYYKRRAEPRFILEKEKRIKASYLLYDELECHCGGAKKWKCHCCILKFAKRVDDFSVFLLSPENRNRVKENTNQEELISYYTLCDAKIKETFINIESEYTYQVKLIE